jgi:hypothetical protein
MPDDLPESVGRRQKGIKGMLDDLLDRAKSGEIVSLSPEGLADLLARAELVSKEDTYLSDMIRILRLDEVILIQETTDGKQIIVRCAPSIEEALAFVRKRLETYERMWDGCGCSISYFDP